MFGSNIPIYLIADFMIAIGYIPSWAVYKQYSFDHVPPFITHLTYCFLGCDVDGSIKFMDPWADLGREEKSLLYGDDIEVSCGNLWKLKHLKLTHSGLKVGISIGGSGCESFGPVLSSRTSTIHLANQLHALATTLNLDYFDFDYEFPSNQLQLNNYILLIEHFKKQSCLQAFLSIPCNLQQLITTNIAKFKSVDYFTVMAYDLSGAWTTCALYHSNLFGDSCHLVCVDSVIQGLKRSIDPQKLILGIPLYGKEFKDCKEIGSVYSGTVCTIDLNDIQPEHEHYDSKCIAAHTVTKSSIIVYDNQRCINEKVKYAREQSLGGVMFWDLSKCKSLSLL